MTTTLSKSHRVLAGLVYGDGNSYAALWNRLPLLPYRKYTFYQEAPWLSFDNGHTTQTHPHRHSTPAGTWQINGPTDATEWATITALHLTDGSIPDGIGNVWLDLANRRAQDKLSVRARLGTAYALKNLSAGLTSPASGNDNPHYFDDQACVRAVIAGLLRPGAPEDAADLAGLDAAYTHALDGVWSARAVAALVAVGLGGGGVARAVDAALAQLPAGSWSANIAADCLARAVTSESQADLADRLENEVLDDIYSYNVSAPETLGALLAHLTIATSPDSLLAGAAAHSRANASLAPLAGAVAAVFFGGDWLPSRLTDQLPKLEGTSIGALRGHSLQDTATLLESAAR